MKKNSRNTKSRIVAAAWKLFYSQGYDDTTIEDIVELSETSKGSFYHYFGGKDELLSTLSELFDDKYEELIPRLEPGMDPVDKLAFLNRELFLMIENTVPIELLGRLFASQLTTRGDRHLLRTDRTYYKLLRQIAVEGLEREVFRRDLTANDIMKAYAMFERGLMYDWCICNGDYSLCNYAQQILPVFLRGFCQ